jgi:hypothetical protein
MTTDATSHGSPGHGDKRPRLQEAAILALLTEPTIEAAARKTGVARTTLLRWLQVPDFQAAHREARRAVMDRAIGILQAATGEAVSALRAALKAEGAERVSAARAIWDFSFRSRELLDLEERLSALEQRVNEDGGTRR